MEVELQNWQRLLRNCVFRESPDSWNAVSRVMGREKAITDRAKFSCQAVSKRGQEFTDVIKCKFCSNLRPFITGIGLVRFKGGLSNVSTA